MRVPYTKIVVSDTEEFQSLAEQDMEFHSLSLNIIIFITTENQMALRVV